MKALSSHTDLITISCIKLKPQTNTVYWILNQQSILTSKNQTKSKQIIPQIKFPSLIEHGSRLLLAIESLMYNTQRRETLFA